MVVGKIISIFDISIEVILNSDNVKIGDILSVEGIDEVHIGLNDLHLAYGQKFMFQLLCDGTVEKLCQKFKEKGVKVK